MKNRYAIVLLFLLSNIFAYGQPRNLTDQLLLIKQSVDSLNKSYPAEKLYLQTDKPNYAIGDTLWFKAYLFNSPTLGLSAKSGVMYIDIANDSNKVVKQMRWPVSRGLSWGNISLDDFPAGNYILRAYTNWMRNFGVDCFYYKRYSVVGEQTAGLRTRRTKQIELAGNPLLKNTTGIELNFAESEDSVAATISVNDKSAKPGSKYFLIGKARNVICYAAVVDLAGKEGLKKFIPKNLFPSAVTHFMLTDTTGHPLSEQLVYINHDDNLHLELTANKPFYAPRDSVSILIDLKDAKGNPIAGNFSIAVTEDNQVKIDSLQDNIVCHVLLTSEVKGYLPQPQYYLNHTNPDLSNLLHNHYWINYSWPENIKKPEYPAETEFTVSGRVLNGFNSAVKATKVTLFSKSPFILRDTVTDKDGRFVFRNFPEIDTPVFFLKAVNHNGKSFNVGIVMDDPKSPIWPVSTTATVNDIIIDTGLISAAKNNRIRNELAYLTPNGHLLKEVKIVAKKIVKGSQNLNGPGNADVVLDEEDLIKARKKSWLDLFFENIKGFREGVYINPITKIPYSTYYIADMYMILIVDGIRYSDMYPFTGDIQGYFTDFASYLKNNTAEDIKGIEVSVSSKYYAAYMQRFYPMVYPPLAFIEVTTRSGNGPIIINTPGKYLYRPLTLSKPAEFYSPNYSVSNSGEHLSDTRSTIYWQPNVNTNDEGKASLSFFTADKPGTYTILIEGTDMNGNLVYKKEKIIVKPTANTTN